MTQVVLTDVSHDVKLEPGTLFQDLKFFISHKVPQRSRFINDIRSNGGEVVPIEKYADIKIADHARKETLPGTYSYRYIENSVRNGELEDLEDHRLGAPEGTVRSVGSTIQPPKSSRTKYTQDDDRILWNWVNETPQKGGGTDGNEIYKQLEARHPQHPWQSWRDRWIKQLKGKPRPFPLPHEAPPTPPSDAPVATSAAPLAARPKVSSKAAPHLKSPVKRPVTATSKETSATSRPDTSKSNATADHHYVFGSFDEDDAEDLIVNGEEIIKVPPEKTSAAWKLWAREHNMHTARDWQTFWEDHVLPRYLKRKAKQVAKTQATQAVSEAPVVTPSSKHKVTSQPLSSPQTEKGSPTSIRQRSPSFHPESPSEQLHSPRIIGHGRTGNATTENLSGVHNHNEEDTYAIQNVVAVDPNTKRKRASFDEEVPSSSPPSMVPSPKRRKPRGPEPVREIASTPDMTPVRSGKRPESPLCIGSEEDEEDHCNLEETPYESPLGKQASDTLSEPGRNGVNNIHRDTTQAIDFSLPVPGEDKIRLSPGLRDEDLEYHDPFFREPTQQVDYEVPPPENGWDDEDSGAEASSESEPIAPESFDPRPSIQETQAILRGKTPAMDFNVPEPEGGWDHLIPSSPVPMPESPHAESEISDVDAQTVEWINARVAKGVSVEEVINVWKAATMDTSLAERVLEIVAKDGEIPTDMKGLWTETDDEDLGATDARKIQRLERKHGKDGLTARWEFLDCYRSA